jgi:hypothetical protein
MSKQSQSSQKAEKKNAKHRVHVKKTFKETPKKLSTLSDSNTLEELITQATEELQQLEPKIERLQKQMKKLEELQQARQKLLTFKFSLEAILSSYTTKSDALKNTNASSNANFLNNTSFNFQQKSFYRQSRDSSLSGMIDFPLDPNWTGPKEDETFNGKSALEKTEPLLRRRNSINYHIFKAVIACGGTVNTQDVKKYLVEQDIRQPGSGKDFTDVPLTDISSRVNYLVRKGLLVSSGQGSFVSRFGWEASTALSVSS